jgi:acyl transferase domain-containing protein
VPACAGVGDFDASLFRVSSAEAVAMDAQQRLLLEVSHEVIAAANPPGSKAKVCKARSPVMLRLPFLASA